MVDPRKPSFKRFLTNMDRIWRLLGLEASRQGADDGTSALDGTAADLMRSTLVLLHATVEDVLRTFQGTGGKNWTFNGLNDAKRACFRIGIPFNSISDVAEMLVLLCRRRQEIVHQADLDSAGVPRPWRIVDTWSLQSMMMVAHLLYFRLFDAVGPATASSKQMLESYEVAVQRMAELGGRLAAGIRQGDNFDWLPQWYEEVGRETQAIRRATSVASMAKP